MERPLVLLVAAGRAEREVRLALRAARAPGESVVRGRLPRRERARQARLEPEHLRARAERPAELRDHGRALQPAAARRRRDEVAEAVGDVEVHGVAARRLAGADRGRRLDERRQAPAAGAQLVRRRLADEPPPLVGVRGREQPLERDVDEVRVAVEGLAVGERELRALDDRVDELRRREARRGRSRRAARAAGAAPGPGPTARSCRPCSRGSRTWPAARASPARRRGRRRRAARPARGRSRRSPRRRSRGRRRRARARSPPRGCRPPTRPRSGGTSPRARGFRNSEPGRGAGRYSSAEAGQSRSSGSTRSIVGGDARDDRVAVLRVADRELEHVGRAASSRTRAAAASSRRTRRGRRRRAARCRARGRARARGSARSSPRRARRPARRARAARLAPRSRRRRAGRRPARSGAARPPGA